MLVVPGVTVSPETVGEFASGVEQLVERGFLVAPSFAHGVDWTESRILEYGRQLLELARWFLSHSEATPIPQLSRSLAPVLDEGGVRRMCGSGQMMATYDVDGNRYPCHLFLPWITGRKSDWYGMVEDGDMCDDRCRDCPYVRVCKHCYGFNLIERGDPAVRSGTVCRLEQSEIRATVSFKGTLFGQKVRNGVSLTTDELVEAKAVLFLSEHPPKNL